MNDFLRYGGFRHAADSYVKRAMLYHNDPLAFETLRWLYMRAIY